MNGLRKLGSVVLVLALVAVSWGTMPAAAQERPIQIVFMHHSTGAGLIWGGGIREAFTALGYEFWDHGYNDDGLTDPAGNVTGDNWDVPGDNTDQDGWYAIFNQPVTDPPSNTFSHMLQADVIIFKSCFPTSNMDSEDVFETYRGYFLSIRDVIDQHPDRLFIAFTTPPLVPNETTLENAARARRWAEYMTSSDYLSGHPNLVVFDFFNLLANEDGFLRADYRTDEWDSHPNELANQTIGPILVEFVDQAIRDFVPGEAVTGPSVPITGGTETGQPEEPGDVTADLFGGFEGESFEWWTYLNDGARSFDCALDAQAYTGEQALRMDFDIAAGGSAGCGVDLPSDPAWADAQGISLYWRADEPGMPVRIGFGVRNPVQPSPDLVEATLFETEWRTAGDEWSQVVVLWDDLIKPDWVGETGVDAFDPAIVVWIVFDVGDWETAQAGTVWIDDIQLVD
jgi:hypothetical protein